MKKHLIVWAGLWWFAASNVQAQNHHIVDDAWMTPKEVHFSGRVTEDGHQPARAHSGAMASTYRSAKLLLASGKAASVSWQVGDFIWQAQSDTKGYWALTRSNALPSGALPPGWHPIVSTPAASSSAGLLVHDPHNGLGIISDIDDTILVTQVNHKRKLLRNSLAIPPEKRLAVAHMAKLYHQLAQRNPHPQATAIFYVSATPRQLTDSTRRFLTRHGFPQGIFQLKEVRARGGDSWGDQKAYKLARLRAIFKAFADTRFILFGDDGEYDPETYHELQEEFADRIESVWIRHVHPDPKRARFEGQGDVQTLLDSVLE